MMENKVLATVNGMPITEADVDDFVRGMGQRGASYNTPEGRAAILEELINSKLLLLDAKRNLLEAEPAFKAQLQKVKDNMLASYALEKALSSITVTDAEAKAYYEENKERFVQGETVNASHILVAEEAAALEILSKIEAGEMSFEEAAKAYSTCPSKENGGSLGDFGKGQMVPEFDTAVFAMSEGEITRTPVQTQFGYHLIRLNKRNAPAAVPYEAVADKLKAQLLSEKQEKAYRSKVNQLKILYPVDTF